MGQGAWALLQNKKDLGGINPFFAIVPHSFLLISVLIAAFASIIASQALISGSFTLISEAISLGFWPRVKVKYPTNIRGQIYIPSINWILFTGCVLVVFYFKTSEAMTAAYGFSITIAMLMTTILVAYFFTLCKTLSFLDSRRYCYRFCVCVETCFFVANAVKLLKRLFFLVFEIGLITTMYVWYNARKITLRLLTFVPLKEYLPLLEQLSNDTSIPKYSTHVVYLTKTSHKQIEKRVIDSIFTNPAKRADFYWLININRADEPFTMDYGVEVLLKNKVIRVDFHLGFRIQPKIGIMLKKVVEEMISNKEIVITNHRLLRTKEQ